MADYIHITCPNCHTPQKIKPKKTASGKSKIKCRHCHTYVLIEDNKVVDEKALIHDEMDLEAIDELIDDDTPLADLEDDPNFEESDILDLGDEWAFTVNASAQSKSKKTFFDSEDDTDITAPVEDESWLESLLADEDEDEDKEPKQQSSQTSQNKPINEHLSSHLSDTAGRNTLGSDSDLNSKKSAKKILTPVTDAVDEQIIVQPKNNETLHHGSNRSLNKLSIATNFLWLLGCIILLALLLVQYTVFNLNTLLKEPEQRARLEHFCATVHCTLPKADITQISITNQSYQPNKNTTNTTDIIAAISNNSNEEQLFPNIKVQLYDNNKVIGEFIAQPEEYLITPQSIIGGLQVTLFMLTVEIDPKTVSRVQITPFY